jgi:hypothetical protein
LGHPASRDIEADINTLLSCGTISGDGTAPENSDEESKSEGTSSPDESKISQAKADFIKDS